VENSGKRRRMEENGGCHIQQQKSNLFVLRIRIRIIKGPQNLLLKVKFPLSTTKKEELFSSSSPL